MAFGRQLLGHLRPKAVHQHELDAHRMQDGEVLHEGVELACGDQFTSHGHDEGLAVIGVDVGRDSAKPGDEVVRDVGAHGAGDCAAALCR